VDSQFARRPGGGHAMAEPYMCPVCNGWSVLAAACPDCGGEASDEGREGDLYGPYSPYRPIDDIRKTNGLPDLREHRCPHAARCRRCGRRFTAFVAERPAPAPGRS